MNGTNGSKATCNKKKLSRFYSKYEPEFHFEQIAKFYDQPCTEMESTVTSTAVSISKAEHHVGASGDLAGRSSDTTSDLKLMIYYRIQHYKLASNDKSFTLLSLWSQVGGFIGIFLGYSLLQVPQLLGNAWTEIEKLINHSKNIL